MSGDKSSFIYKLDKSALLTFIGIVILFGSAVVVTLIAPTLVEKQWVVPTSSYQSQMYEEADPNIYISTLATGSENMQAVYHLQEGGGMSAFTETETVRIVAPAELAKYVTRFGETTLKLTPKLLMLRTPVGEIAEEADRMQKRLQDAFVRQNRKGVPRPRFEIRELYVPRATEAFALADTDGVTENWVDSDFEVVDATADIAKRPGWVYVNNPQEYRITRFSSGPRQGFEYDPRGTPIASLEELESTELGFMSRKDLISFGEHLYAIEGCHYCHTDQSRTLVQDSVLNGSDSYPAPPSSPNEYVYQEITFPGTRRIGPDLSRVGVKRPSRDWHKSHFWSPKTASAGTIMPAFRHFFDDDPRGTSKSVVGVPNYQFEAIFQYLMTKGTRITPPNQAWWTGDDPIHTIDIIEGRI